MTRGEVICAVSAVTFKKAADQNHLGVDFKIVRLDKSQTYHLMLSFIAQIRLALCFPLTSLQRFSRSALPPRIVHHIARQPGFISPLVSLTLQAFALDRRASNDSKILSPMTLADRLSCKRHKSVASSCQSYNKHPVDFIRLKNVPAGYIPRQVQALSN